MLVKLNKRVIEVTEDNEKENEKSWVYWGVSACGYVLVLWIMDIVCYTFFYIHPFPFLSFLFHGVSGWITFVGRLF